VNSHEIGEYKVYQPPRDNRYPMEEARRDSREGFGCWRGLGDDPKFPVVLPYPGGPVMSEREQVSEW
jgi:hypothetical protein